MGTTLTVAYLRNAIRSATTIVQGPEGGRREAAFPAVSGRHFRLVTPMGKVLDNDSVQRLGDGSTVRVFLGRRLPPTSRTNAGMVSPSGNSGGSGYDSGTE